MTGCAPGTLETALDLLPGAAKETFLLEIILEHTDGEVAQFLWQVEFKLPFYSGFYALEVLAKILNLLDI